jgi:hypothetical protein
MGTKCMLLVIESRSTALSGGVWTPHVTKLIDFGPYEYSETMRKDTNVTVQLPLPRAATKFQSPDSMERVL